MKVTLGVACVFAAATTLGCAISAWAVDPSRVLVLYNAESAEGAQVAAYYAQVHPGARLLALNNVPAGEQITADSYLSQIRPQILPALSATTDYIVTTRGLPLRIDAGASTTLGWMRYSSLESELTRIDGISSVSQMGMQNWMQAGSLAFNPYRYKNTAFTNAAYGIRLTSRLDGFSAGDAMASIARAQFAFIGHPSTRFVVDDDPLAPGTTADRMTQLVNNVLTPRGLQTVYDTTRKFVQDAPGVVLGYVSHGTNATAPSGYLSDTVNGLHFDKAPGAVFQSWESFNAYSFNAGGNRNGQSLIAEWIAHGGTAAVGTVEEPGASAYNVTNEDRMFDRLLSGYTWAEAAWNATTQLSYVNTVVGDPLMTLRPWLCGDANLDGFVDSADLGVLGQEWTNAVAGLMADFNGDGTVDTADLGILGGNWLEAAPAAATLVPTPGALPWVLLAAAILKRRRHT